AQRRECPQRYRRCRIAGPDLRLRCSPGLGAPPSSARRLKEWPLLIIGDEPRSVLAFHGQHAFTLGTARAVRLSYRRLHEARRDLGHRRSCRLVATADSRLTYSASCLALFTPPAGAQARQSRPWTQLTRRSQLVPNSQIAKSLGSNSQNY